MQDVTTDSLPFPSAGSANPAEASASLPLSLMEPRDALSQVLFDGARQMLIKAIEIEAATWIKQREHLLDDQGHRQVVRNGHAAARKLVTPMGPMMAFTSIFALQSRRNRASACWCSSARRLMAARN